MRGHVRSFSPDRPEISSERFADDAIDLIEESGYYRAHLVGLSMGGVVAQEIFRRAPTIDAVRTSDRSVLLDVRCERDG